MIINHNINAMNANRQLGMTNTAGAKSMEKLSSGYRINRAGDDAAGLSISEKMRGQIRGLKMASKNAQDGISLIQTAEGALNETHAILQRMRELADQSANGTNTNEDRGAIQDEITQLTEEIDRIGDTTEFNTKKLLDGSLKSVAGAAVGLDSTTGAQIAKLTTGKITADNSMGTAANKAVDADFVEETLTIDGTEIKVRWQDLSTDEKNTLKNVGTDAASRNAAADLIEQKINDAIDESGTGIQHVNVYADSTSHKLVVESGTKGIDSKVDVGAAGILKKVSGTYASADGTAKYNGTDIAAGSTADLYVGDLLLKFSTTAISNGDDMSAAATAVETAINNAISGYNTDTGKSEGDEGFIQKVTVAASDDGRLIINSESGPVRLSDNAGSSTVEDLGLSDAQTSAGGNGGMTLQIGANKGQTMTFGINDMRSASLGISGVDVGTQAGASNALETLDGAIKKVSEQRSALGAAQNRLEHTIKNLDTSAENLQASESRIRDTDMAKEMMQFTKNNILQQAAQAMLAQANQAPQGVLQLLR